MTTESENRILIEAVRIAAEQIESLKEELSMTRAQALIRKDLIEKLKSGPGGIMEMKQTIADLESDLKLVYEHDSNLLDHLKGWK